MRSILIICLFALFAFSMLYAQTPLENADSLYDLRSENFNTTTLLAAPANIDQAIDLYKQAIASLQGEQKAEATWKLIRAYYFKGRYTTNDSEAKKTIFDLGKNVGEKAIKEFPKSPGIYLFTAIVWGVWGEEYGIFKAAKEGVAGTIKEYCEKVNELDPGFDHAGGYRVLGRVYFKAPKIWPILRWPSNEDAIKFFKKGLELAPDNLTTKKFLAETLYKEDQEEQAIKIMEEILTVKEAQDGIAEHAVIINEVKNLLKEWKD